MSTTTGSSPGSAPAPSTAPNPDQAMHQLLAVVRDLVLEVSDGRGVGRLGADVSFERELGLGSLERVELAVRAGQAFGVRLSEDAIATADSPRQLMKHIVAQRGASAEPLAPTAAPTATNKPALLPTQAPAPEPIHATTLLEVLEYQVQQQPDRVHIVLEDDDETATPITYRSLYTAALTVATALRARGLAPGRSVAIMLPTGLGYFASFLGALLAGGVPVPLYPPVRLDRISEYITRCTKILDNAEAQVLITFDRAAKVADLARHQVASVEHVVSVDGLLAEGTPREASAPLWAEVAASDTALIQYTSGSTGDPKGVELTHANVLANIRAARAGCELGPDDIMVSWLPLYHDMGLIGGWLMCFYYGAPTVLMSPMAFLSRPERWLLALSQYGGTCSVAPNFAFDLCVRRIGDDVLPRLDLSRLRSVLNGSEPIMPRTLDRFVERFGPVGMRREAFFCAYGLAENMVAVTMPPVLQAPQIDRVARVTFETEGRAVPTDDEDALAFVGVGSAVPEHEVMVADERGNRVPERHQGMIWFRGPSSFKGYFRRPDATAEVQRPGGWVVTGDLGYMADGQLFVTGRSKDLIIKGGRNYYPQEIEAAAASVSGIRQGCVAAFAVPDESNGTERIIVIAETRERDATTREALQGRVLEAVTERVGVPPDEVVLAMPGAVPKTSSGKIRRSESRQRYLDGSVGKARPSGAFQAADLFARSLPSRALEAAAKARDLVYGSYAAATLGSFCAVAPLVGRLTPTGGTARRAAAIQARTAMTLARLHPRVTGRERIPSGAAIFVANHSGYLDFLICASVVPPDTRFVIKGELRHNKLIGPMLEKMGHVFIDRHSTARTKSDLQELVVLLERGERIIVFPEGTFSATVGLRSFKLGAFRLACETGTPIVPVAIRGSRRALRDGTWLPKHRAIEVDILDPIRPPSTPCALSDIVALRDRCAEAIARHIDEPRLHAADISVPGAKPPAL